MIRYEVKTPHKCFVGYEQSIKDAKSYINSLIKSGVEIVSVEYFNKEQRENDIRAGKV